MSLLKANAVQLGQSVTATNNFTWYQPSSPDGTVRLGNGNSGSVTDLVTLTSAGNLGIGTSSPVAKLMSISSSGYPFGAANASYGIRFNPSVPTVSGMSLEGVDPTLGVSYQALGLGGSILQFLISGAEKMRLDSSGNLGLGVTPPSGATSNGMYFGSAGSTIGLGNGLQLAGNTYWDGAWKYRVSSIPANRIDINAGNAGTIGFFTAPSGTAGNAISFTQAMTLDASGNLLIGDTSSVGTRIYARYGGAGVNTAFFRFDTTDDRGVVVIRHDGSSGATSRTAVRFENSGGAQVGHIDCTGSATTYVTSSDQRLKTNITPAGSAIQSILDFPVDQFDWVGTGEHQDFGAVAQKAINVIPEMVSVPADEDEMWGIDWSKAVPRLIKAIQELSAELNELKGKIA